MPELPKILAAYGGIGYVVAPAGFGKTHLIAASLCHAEKRQLVLTHTYAGVNALRRKMRQIGVPNGASRIDTIASWALRLSLSYPEASRWSIERPDQEQWAELYRACCRLLEYGFIRRVLRASYGGLYVDEYQDCSRAQHDIVLRALATCRAASSVIRFKASSTSTVIPSTGTAMSWRHLSLSASSKHRTVGSAPAHRVSALGSEMSVRHLNADKPSTSHVRPEMACDSRSQIVT